ncbi:ribonuclease domain-containing protein [Mycobacterium sp. pUA109]|uniref:ribonuclease domain-containing protein n=1 Tax=Mycobacterium sp. pUA109 TaxID=3238982 RepID=UPI00351B25FD
MAAVCALIAAAVIGWALVRTTSSGPTPPPGSVPTCSLGSLPREARDTVRAIQANGPFPFPRHDGVVFANREGHLPDRSKGYYHEYTVKNPRARNRSTRRIVTGGSPLTNPAEYFYTADHYDSFCLITDVGRQP